LSDLSQSPSHPFANLVAPILFVFIWSTGFIVAKFGLPYAPPLTFLLLRYSGVVLLLLPTLLLVPAPWPYGTARHIAVSGMLVQAGYLSGVWSAISMGMPAGLAALIVGIQPVLTAFAASWVGETVGWTQWFGLAAGLAGVALVVSHKITTAGVTVNGLLLCVMALVSFTVGTLYQKRFCPQFNLRIGALIQFSAAALVTLPFALTIENLSMGFQAVQWTPQFVGALAWAVFALSIGAMFLLYVLIRKNAATHVSSLMYLTPAVTSVMAWFLFDEPFTLMSALGILLVGLGVAFVVKK
jgi:drug/metabolite transporter (DMT)-like permease